jgi:uncharacterized membrane protein
VPAAGAEAGTQSAFGLTLPEPAIRTSQERTQSMLWTILVVLLAIWLIANIAAGFGNGFLHLILVVAAIVLLFQLLSGRRAA